jgi:hypothetical protein
LPDGLETIGQYAFHHCRSLVEIVVPDTVQLTVDERGDSKSNSVFAQCERLRKARIPDSWTEIPDSFFCGCDLVDINIPPGLTKISGYAFCGTSLETIVLPESICEIEASAFDGCKSLKEMVIPENVRNIGNATFKDCGSLKAIVIPENVRNIGEYAFMGCSNLESVTILSPVMVQFELTEAYQSEELELWVFAFISPNAVLKVPEALLEEYITFIEKHPYRGKSFARIEGI